MLGHNRISAVLVSTDLATSEAFYQDKVGLTLSPETIKNHLVFECGDGSTLLIYGRPSGNQADHTQVRFWSQRHRGGRRRSRRSWCRVRGVRQRDVQDRRSRRDHARHRPVRLVQGPRRQHHRRLPTRVVRRWRTMGLEPSARPWCTATSARNSDDNGCDHRAMTSWRHRWNRRQPGRDDGSTRTLMPTPLSAHRLGSR